MLQIKNKVIFKYFFVFLLLVIVTLSLTYVFSRTAHASSSDTLNIKGISFAWDTTDPSHDGALDVILTYKKLGAAKNVSGTLKFQASYIAPEPLTVNTDPYTWSLVGSCTGNCVVVWDTITGENGSSVPSGSSISLYGDQNEQPTLTLTITIVLASFPSNNNYTVPVTGGSTSVGKEAPWVDTLGFIPGSPPILKFISPQVIEDTTTGGYYISSGSGPNGSEYSSDGGSNAADFLNDGDTLFWPSTGVLDSSTQQCLGGIDMMTYGDHYYVKLNLVPTQLSGGQCVFGPKDEVSSYAINATNSSPGLPSNIPVSNQNNAGVFLLRGSPAYSELQNIIEGDPGYSTPITIPLNNYNNVFALFEWNDSKTLVQMGATDHQLQIQTGSKLSGYLSSLGLSGSNYDVFTSSACSEIDPPLLVINKNDLSTGTIWSYSTGSGAGFGDSSSTGYIGSQSWGSASANGIGCLFAGGNVPSNNYNKEASNAAGSGNTTTTYIAYTSQSTASSPLVPHTANSKSPPVSPDDVCQPGGINLSWIICPIVDGLVGLETDVETWIGGLLQTPLIVVGTCNNNSNSSTSSQDCSDINDIKTAWGNFRLIADIVLVVALIIAIIVEAAGGGVAEAYSVRKLLPRILVTAILINLSIYIIAGLEDVINVVGAGIMNLLQTVFGSGNWPLTANGFSSDIAGISLASLLTASGIIWSGPFLVFLLVFILLPALFVFLATLFTIIIRQGILLLLLITSPIAFALYCLPNTEQYFHKWWGLLSRTLMVYPIMMVLFATGDIGYRVMNFIATSGGGTFQNLGGTSGIGGLLAFIALLAPLFFMPYAFKLSGGVIGGIYDGLHSLGNKAYQGILGNPNNPMSLRNKTKRGLANKFISRGSDAQSYLKKRSLEGERQFKRRTTRRLATAALWASPDFDKYRKDQNVIFDREISEKVANGSDALERAFFAKQWTDPDKEIRDENGNVTQKLRTGRWYSSYRGSDGKFQEHAPGIVARAHRSYDGDESKIQTLIKYETGKVANDQDFYGVNRKGETIYDPSQISSQLDEERMPLGSFMSNLPTVMQNAGLSQTSAAGASIGSFFSTQNQRKELKHTKLDENWQWKRDDNAYVQDWAENMGAYAASTSKTSPIRSLTKIANDLKAKEASGSLLNPAEKRSKQDLQRIGVFLDQRLQASGGMITPEADRDAIPAAGSQAPARVADAMQDLITATRDW